MLSHVNVCSILHTWLLHLCLQAASFVSDYLVEQLIFEEALDLCVEGQPRAVLTKESINECILDGETAGRGGAGEELGGVEVGACRG